jgi:hypothetical protein
VGRWTYVAALHASRSREPISEHVSLLRLGVQRPLTPVLVFDWRTGRWTRLEPDGGWDVQLAWQEWDYRIVCPLLPGDRALFGDVGKYASVGDRRIANIEATADALRFDVLGAAQSTVEVQGYAPVSPSAVEAATAGARRQLARGGAAEGWSWDARDARDGRWIVRVGMGRGEAQRLHLVW